MSIKLKPLCDQTVVLTGATSGIGLVTARMAAKAGAALFLIARNEEALEMLAGELGADGVRVGYRALDVGDESAVNLAADSVLEKFGNFDTWVNNAGVSIYGRLEEVASEDSRRLFETNFWGVVNGSLAAARVLKQQREAGVIVNVGSVLSDRAIPLQGMYCASKHAVKGFTDAFRMELEEDGAPVSVTLIKPSAVDTPYKEHARNYLPVEPENPPPVYAPETVAAAILHAAENPVRDIFVGGGGKALSIAGKLAPRTTDLAMEKLMFRLQKTERPARPHRPDGLFASRDSRLQERGGYSGHVSESSLFTRMSLNPALTVSILTAVGVGAYALSRSLWGTADRDRSMS